jgi:hypothetical protein
LKNEKKKQADCLDGASSASVVSVYIPRPVHYDGRRKILVTSRKSSFVLAAVTLPTLNSPSIYDDMHGHRGKRFAENSDLAPTIFFFNSVVVDTRCWRMHRPAGAKCNPNKSELGSNHYRLSSLILRHCQRDTGFSDDATRLLKDDARFGGGIVEGTRSRSRREEQNEEKKRKNRESRNLVQHDIPFRRE